MRRIAARGDGLGSKSQRPGNLAAILRQIVDGSEPQTRAELALSTGLTRASVSALVDSLVAARLVVELPIVAARRTGRPGIPLAPARGTVAAVGAEVNVDYLATRVVDISGGILAERVVAGDFRHSDPRDVLRRLRALIRASLVAMDAQGVALAGVGLALPGLVDAVGGPLRIAPNLGWRNLDIAAMATVRNGSGRIVPVMGNEADLSARAEVKARRITGPASFIYVSGEVGIGAAIVVDGRVFRGQHGWSGEIGHTLVSSGRSPASGVTLEAVAGQDAMLAAAGLPVSAPLDELIALAGSGDTRAARALARAGDALGVALVNVVNIVDIDHVVLGGVYAQLAGMLRRPITARLGHHAMSSPWSPVQVEAAVSGPLPAVTGAAHLLLDGVIADPHGWVAGRM